MAKNNLSLSSCASTTLRKASPRRARHGCGAAVEGRRRTPRRQEPALRLEFVRPAPQSGAAAGAVEVSVFGEREVEGAAAAALALERFRAADEAEAVLLLVGAEAPTGRASLRRIAQRAPRSQASGSTAPPRPRRISKCRCARRSGSAEPTAPTVCP